MSDFDVGPLDNRPRLEVNDPVPMAGLQSVPVRTMETDGDSFGVHYNSNVLAWLEEDCRLTPYYLYRNLLLQRVPWASWFSLLDQRDGTIEWIMWHRLQFRRRQALLALGVPGAEERASTVDTSDISAYAQARIARYLQQFIDDCALDRITLFAIQDVALNSEVVMVRLLGTFFALVPKLENIHPEMHGMRDQFDFTAMGRFLKAIGLHYHALCNLARRVCDRLMFTVIYPWMMQSLFCNRQLFPMHFESRQELCAANATLKLCTIDGGRELALTADPPSCLLFGARYLPASDDLYDIMFRRIRRSLKALDVIDEDVIKLFEPVMYVRFSPRNCGIACSDGCIYELNDWPLFCLGHAIAQFTHDMMLEIREHYALYATTTTAAASKRTQHNYEQPSACLSNTLCNRRSDREFSQLMQTRKLLYPLPNIDYDRHGGDEDDDGGGGAETVTSMLQQQHTEGRRQYQQRLHK
jgi:hypothetical protein